MNMHTLSRVTTPVAQPSATMLAEMAAVASQSLLQDQMRTLCEEHGLTYLAAQIYRRPDGTFHFGAGAHDEHFAVQSGFAEEDMATPASAIRSAIEKLNRKRTVPVVVPELSPLDAALGRRA